MLIVDQHRHEERFTYALCMHASAGVCSAGKDHNSFNIADFNIAGNVCAHALYNGRYQTPVANLLFD